ncbi:MAG: hypothetical protein ACO1RX_03655 [Candidatus Sericytochromatia bacterium]
MITYAKLIFALVAISISLYARQGESAAASLAPALSYEGSQP